MLIKVISIIVCVLIICALTLLAKKMKVAYPILLVVAGLCISFIPGIPVVQINPELIFIIFLPPLLFEAAYYASWKEIWKWRRIIFSFAFPIVFITATGVALVANTFIPGFSIALGFLLGGIISPPDAVSAQAIMKFVKVPKRISTILEGESLFNDASSLIIMRFAMVAVGTGQFVWYHAIGNFVWMMVGGILVGLAIGWVMMRLQKAIPTDINVNVVFTIIAPYIIYVTAEELWASGVIAVVTGGIYLSQHNILFMDSSSRLSSEHFWGNFVFLINGFVFLLIGLDLPEIVAAVRASGLNLTTATIYGLIISGALILIRITCTILAMLTTLIMRHFIKVADPNYYGYQPPLIIGWSGMRGVVSLAAALSIPLTIDGGLAFPHRATILYITFIVILVTLLLQGLTLPFLIKSIKLPEFNDHLPRKTAENIIRKGMAAESLKYLQRENVCDSVASSHLLSRLVDHWEQQINVEESTPLYDSTSKIYRQILINQRLYLYNLNKSNKQIDKDIIYHFIHRIDLEEERIKSE